LIVALVLAMIAFGSRNVMRTFEDVAHLVALAFTHDGIRLIAFAGLGLMGLFGAFWSLNELIEREKVYEAGIVLAVAGLAGGFLAVGGLVLGMHFGRPATGILWVGSPFLLIVGVKTMAASPPSKVLPPPPSPPPGRAYPRKQVTTYGDARSADDWEIDEALRNKSGGFDPMFKD
jgi:hypothetical protein